MAPRITIVVRTLAQARTYLGSTLKHFRAGRSEPLIFGDNDKPEAVVIPFEAYTRLVAYDEAAAEAFAQKLSSRIADANASDVPGATLEELADDLGEPASSMIRKLAGDVE